MLSRILILVTTLLILGGVNFSIYQKEQLSNNGLTLLLELAPVDPRSLMQGDYMILRYRIAEEAEAQIQRQRLDLKRGLLVVAYDNHQVAKFKGLYDGRMALKSTESLLYFRAGKDEIRLGAESFFFQEGHAQYYEKAKYGELRVAPSGESILVGLRDEDFNRLGQ